MTSLRDLDELIAPDEFEGDVELVSEIAKASSKVAEKEQRKVMRARDLGQVDHSPVVDGAVDE